MDPFEELPIYRAMVKTKTAPHVELHAVYLKADVDRIKRKYRDAWEQAMIDLRHAAEIEVAAKVRYSPYRR